MTTTIKVKLPAWQHDLLEAARAEYNAKNPPLKLTLDDIIGAAVNAYIKKV